VMWSYFTEVYFNHRKGCSCNDHIFLCMKWQILP